jgi:hypothetical protein
LFLERELSGDTLPLDEREAHYLGHVLRLQRGDELVAFNGRGAERIATVRALHRRGAELDLGAEHSALPESPLDLTLVQAIVKADAMDLIVQKSTELGVRAIRPVFTEFSVAWPIGARLLRAPASSVGGIRRRSSPPPSTCVRAATRFLPPRVGWRSTSTPPRLSLASSRGPARLRSP